MIVTWCPEEMQIARMLARGMTEQEAQQRMAAQLPSAEKKARADYVIDTSGSKEDTNRQIDKIFDELVEIVQPSAPAGPPQPGTPPAPPASSEPPETESPEKQNSNE